MLADIIDLDTLRARQARPASFFALGTLLYKLGFGLGGSLSLLTLAACGYEIAATRPAIHAGMPLGIVLSVIAIPLALLLVAALLMWRMPLDSRRHTVIARRLQRRAKRRSAHAGPLATWT